VGNQLIKYIITDFFILSCIKNEFLFATNSLSPHYYETLKSTVTFKSRKRHKHREAFFKFFYSAAILKRRKEKRFRDILFQADLDFAKSKRCKRFPTLIFADDSGKQEIIYGYKSYERFGSIREI